MLNETAMGCIRDTALGYAGSTSSWHGAKKSHSATTMRHDFTVDIGELVKVYAHVKHDVQAKLLGLIHTGCKASCRAFPSLQLCARGFTTSVFAGRGTLNVRYKSFIYQKGCIGYRQQRFECPEAGIQVQVRSIVDILAVALALHFIVKAVPISNTNCHFSMLTSM
jgi:hypothetical protein